MQRPIHFTLKNNFRLAEELSQPAELFLLSVILIVWVGATINMRPLSIPDEGRYVGVAWEMVRSDQWLTPALNGLPYFHKPPLFYWITAASLTVFGPHEWAARIAPLTGALIAALSIYSLMRSWVASGIARLTVLILATSPFFYGGAQFANHDMLVAGFITATIAFAAQASLSMQTGQPYRIALSAAWVSAALGLLSKGLIGIVLPGGVIMCWLLADGNWRALTRLCWWPGLILFAVIASPWFAMMEFKYAGFLHYFFIEQQFDRFVGTGFNNRQACWFLPIVLVILNLPWSVFLFIRSRLPNKKHPHVISVRRLLWIWLILIVIFFSIPQSKLIGYVLPVVPAMAALIALGLEAQPYWSRTQNLIRPGMILLAGLFCVMTVAGIAINDKKSTQQLANLYLGKAQPVEKIVFLNVYPFDMAFYMHSKLPIVVVEDWGQKNITTEDSWRKELLEAGRFAPASSKNILLPNSSMPALLCKNPVTWVLTTPSVAITHTYLKTAQVIGKNENYFLLRFSRSGMQCAENF